MSRHRDRLSFLVTVVGQSNRSVDVAPRPLRLITVKCPDRLGEQVRRGLLAREAELPHRAAGDELGITEGPPILFGDDPAQRLRPLDIQPDETINRWTFR